MKDGTIQLNGPQREYVDIKINDTLKIKPFRAGAEHMIGSLSITLSPFTAKKENTTKTSISADDLSKQFKLMYMHQVVQVGQTV